MISKSRLTGHSLPVMLVITHVPALKKKKNHFFMVLLGFCCCLDFPLVPTSGTLIAVHGLLVAVQSTGFKGAWPSVAAPHGLQ